MTPSGHISLTLSRTLPLDECSPGGQTLSCRSHTWRFCQDPFIFVRRHNTAPFLTKNWSFGTKQIPQEHQPAFSRTRTMINGSQLLALFAGLYFSAGNARWREKKAKNNFPQSSSLIQRSASDSTRKHNMSFFSVGALISENDGRRKSEKGKQPTPARYNKSESLPRELQCKWQTLNFSSDILRNFSNPQIHNLFCSVCQHWVKAIHCTVFF